MFQSLVWKTGPSTPRAKSISNADWEVHKEIICRLYQSTTLDELMKWMQEQYGFTASRKQYVLQLNKWAARKYKRPRDSLSLNASEPSGVVPIRQDLDKLTGQGRLEPAKRQRLRRAPSQGWTSGDGSGHTRQIRR
ncbi:hypothetical protein QBC34DRAFT_382319 [Podospora aff. communis PSN243]|uniref:Clr5 domain-containing protein n=1 Tax=Podospora aff. communis PSN243 TaxID=3040156 RepID=A0AAV9GGR9_9PEZI|nr:hypothetical protein QBC34DRAFT_382319 [Podospora aff. communis PSN243]